MTRAVYVALLVTACTITPDTPPPAPPDGAGDCHTACATLTRLGGCNLIAPETCEKDCNTELNNEAAIGVRFPVGCLTVAKSCEEALQCK